MTTAPWHSSSDGIAERIVQTPKKALFAVKGELSPNDNLNKFLIMYRNTPHTLTNEPPALLFIGRRLKMRLDLVKPDLKRHVDNEVANIAKCQRSPAEFKVGDKVAVQDYRNLTGVRRQKGVVLSRMSKFMYKVKVASNVILIRHFDQMLPGSRFPMPEYHNDNFRATDDIKDDLKLCSDNVQ